MASDLEDIVQRIALEGDDELVNGLERAGEEGEKAFKKLQEAATTASEASTQLATIVGYLATGFAIAAAAVTEWVEIQDAASQKSAQLAEAMGATRVQLNAVEAAFAAGGVSAQQFERFAQRLTTTISQQWPTIAKNIRDAGVESDSAQERIVASNVRIEEANNNLETSYAESAQKLDAANARVAASYVALEFQAQKTALQISNDFNSTTDAALAVEAARNKLATDQGSGPSKAEQADFQLRKDQAALNDALTAQEQKSLEVQEHRAQLALQNTTLQNNAKAAALGLEKAEQEASLASVKAQNEVKEAVTARQEAENHAADLLLNNIPKISEAFKNLAAGNKDAASAIDFSAVAATKLKDALLAATDAAAPNGKPTGYEALKELSTILKEDGDAAHGLIDASTRLNLVQTLGGRISQQFSASASHLLAVLEQGPQAWDKFTAAAQRNYASTDKGQAQIHDFVTAFESLKFSAQQAQQNLAALISPALVAFLNELESSIRETDGILHELISGIQFIIGLINDAVEAFQKWHASLSPDELDRFNDAVLGIKIAVAGLAVFVASLAGAWLLIPVAIGLVIAAYGALYANAQKIKEILTDNSIVRFWERLLDVITKVKNLFSGNGWKGAAVTSVSEGSNTSQSQSQPPTSSSPLTGDTSSLKYASGGVVDGPGTATSDSVFARLSRGEFVMRAAAVQSYGADFMQRINSMAFPGFAMGGLVPSPVRLSGSSGSGATSTVNLSIDGHAFNGFKGPKATVDSLSSFAIQRQTSAAGRNPSWVR